MKFLQSRISVAHLHQEDLRSGISLQLYGSPLMQFVRHPELCAAVTHDGTKLLDRLAAFLMQTRIDAPTGSRPRRILLMMDGATRSRWESAASFLSCIISMSTSSSLLGSKFSSCSGSVIFLLRRMLSSNRFRTVQHIDSRTYRFALNLLELQRWRE